MFEDHAQDNITILLHWISPLIGDECFKFFLIINFHYLFFIKKIDLFITKI